MEEFKNSIQEEIKSILKLGNACYYSVQNLLSSSLLSKNVTGEWRRLHNEELSDLYSLPNIVHPSILLALQPWVSLGLLDNQSPLLPILRLLCPLSYLLLIYTWCD